MAKGLSGLGGAAALTTGGVFLKNHVVRVNRLKAYDEKTNRFERELRGNGNENNDDHGTYLLRSNEPDVFWEWMWISEVWSGVSGNKEYTKGFMEEKEKSRWSGSAFSEDKRKKVDEEYPNYEYWQKYREVCFLLIEESATSNDIGGNGGTCLGDYPWSTYEKKNEYKEYLKLEGKISFREFLWTIWRKFQADKKSDLSGKEGETVLPIYEQWKGENSGLFPQTTT